MRYDGIGEKQGNTGICFFISDLFKILMMKQNGNRIVHAASYEASVQSSFSPEIDRGACLSIIV